MGRRFEVLVEGLSREGIARGRTACNRVAHFDPGALRVNSGDYVTVQIARGLPNSLMAIPAA